jgi:predicted Zn-dependent peptidase
MTIYFVNIPSNRLEGWFWMESDRLLDPMFREFDKEVSVVHEERELRIDSTPTGALDEEVRRMFWGSHPYSIGPQGIPEEVDRLNRPMAQDFFRRHYGPETLTAALVGGFDSDQVKSWAQKYFSRLESPVLETEQEPIIFASAQETGDRRLDATCDCSTQAQVHYPSVAFGHPDAYPLDLLAGILNGRTGRLYRSLVLDQEIAFAAYARQRARKQAGQFSFLGETKGEVSPSDLVAAWDQEVARLKTVPATDEEISRTVNRLSADAFRSLKDPFALMSQLLYYQGLGDWRHIVEWPRGIGTIGAVDIQRVARQYLDEDRRTVALYERRSSAPKPKSAAAP